MGMGFVFADFSAAFIVCSWGVEEIGYVMVCFGAVCATSCLIFGQLVKLIGRIPIFLLGGAINISLVVVMLFFWRPDPVHHPEYFYIIAGLWGVAQAVWDTQINGN